MSLPTGYVQLEYIESTGTQYIDTGVLTSNTLRWELDCAYKNLSSSIYRMGYIGATSSPYNRFHTNVTNSSNIAGLFEGAQNFSLTNENRHTWIIDAKNKKAWYDNESITFSGTLTKFGNFCLFARNTNGYIENYCKAQLYRSKFYENDVLVRDFVPAYQFGTGNYGLYDLVNDVFYSSATSTNFVGGGSAIIDNNITLDDNPLSFSVQDDVSLIANFKLKWQIDLNYDSTFGIADFQWQGNDVTLTATLKNGAVFNGWYYNGTLLSSSNPYTFTPSQDMTIDVSMGYQYTYTLNYDSSLGSATITRDFTDLNLLTLSATLNSNAQFKGWYDNSVQISSSLNDTYILGSNAVLEARFDEVFDITDSVSGSGAISYTRGSDLNDVVFTVIPNANHHFVKYEVNGADYATTPLSLHLTEDITIVAYIEEDDKYHITASTTFQYGSIYISDNDVYSGTVVTLWARPFPDYVFDHWEDGSYDNPRTITVTENVTLVAIYQRLMDTNGIYQYRCFIKDQLDLEATPKSFMVVDTFNIRTDLLTKSTSTITVMEMPTNVNEGDVVVLYDPKGTFLYNGVINSIEDLTLNCSQMQSYFKGTWIYNIYPSSYLEAELAYLLGQYAQGKLYKSTYTDGLVAQRLGGFTIDYVGSTSINLPTDLDEDGNENLTTMDMEDFMYECYEKYGIMFIFEVNVSGANYIHIKTPTYQSIKVGNNMYAIQNMTPITEIEETNKLVVFASDKTYRTTYVATTNGIVENPSTTANRFNITNTNIVFSDDDLADLVANNLPSTMFNHKLEYDLIIRNFLYGFDDFKLGGSIDVYYNDNYFNTVLTGYEISKSRNTNIISVHFICGKVRTSLTKLLTRKAIL